MTKSKNPSETLIIFVLLLTTLAHVLDFVIMMPLGPKLMQEFGITASDFGKIVAVYTFAAALSSLGSTAWVDRINRKKALLLLLIGFTVGNLLCVWSPTVSVLVIGRLVAGIFGGVMTAIVYSIIGQIISVERRGKAAGMMGTAFPLVSVLGVPFALKMADFYGWRSSFVIVLGMSALSLIMSIIALPSVEPESDGEPHSLLGPVKRALSYPAHRVGIVLCMIIVFGGFTIVPYIAPFLINNGYIIESQLYLVYLVGGSCSIFSARIIGQLSDRFGKIAVLRWLLVLTIAALALFTNLPHHSLALVLISMSFAMMVLPGRFVCVMAFLTIISQPKSRGAYMSLVATIQQLTIGLASILGGMLVGEGPGGTLDTFWLAGIFAISCNAIVLFWSPSLLKYEKSATGASG